jgi:death-on-curing protein
MDGSTRDCLVTGYEGLIPALELPDPDDRHVLAAAIVGRCDVIVTQNLKDFPEGNNLLSSPGVRDRGAVESALDRAKNLFAYEDPDLFDLAAAYTCGLSQNHGFIDGNKRSAFVTGALFLEVNGYRVVAEQAEVIAAMLSLAEHLVDEAGYAQWLRDHVVLKA